ncbi:MAG: class I SAM-dependent RNA methyltransferase [Defluviitaleaceae bacterium]|nr:class I SAM-dependent RNA methyltransferase [Defluviitaleaceae bacterium]
MHNLQLIATTSFGLEAIVKREVEALARSNEIKDIAVQDGRVNFSGNLESLVAANLWLRCADRVLLRMGQFSAYTFDELFEQTKALPWADWIPKDGKFTVLAKSVRSKLFSVSDIQSIVKKAVVEKLKQTYHIEHFEETGPEYTITAAFLKDVVTLTIDTTGHRMGLHKRGYRAQSAVAPLKETMAAALISLSYWKPGRILLDPTCGSGTIPIEAALMAKNIAPGLSRSFISEFWTQIPAEVWKNARKQAYAAIDTSYSEPLIFASDLDPAAIELAKSNAEEAGVEDCISFEQKSLDQITLPGQYGVAISNPPYGERLGKMQEVHQLYADMGRLFKDPTWSVYVLTSDEFFESAYNKKANAKRKLFNGNIKTDYYQYYGERPSRSHKS